MNLSIMYGMLNYLLKKEKVSADELAETFEISPRSVYRYVEHIAAQNIPLEAKVGRNGGIMIDKKFKLDRVLLTQDELDFLKNLLEKNDCQHAKTLRQKLNLF